MPVTWSQTHDPLGSPWASTAVAAAPLLLLLLLIASGRVKAQVAAGLSLAAAFAVVTLVFGMPVRKAGAAVGLGALTGFFPIGWIILNVIFLYRMTVETGWFGVIQKSVGRLTSDRRLQVLLVAFCFGAFFEGAAGFGTPVAVTGAILYGLGFSPLAAAGLSLIANTAPVAFGALGAPVQGLATVTGLDPIEIGKMIGRQVPIFSFIVPFWLIWAFSGRRGVAGVWPAILVCALAFAIPQFLVSNLLNPWIVDLVAAVISLSALIAFLKIWQPKSIWASPALPGHKVEDPRPPRGDGIAGERGLDRSAWDAPALPADEVEASAAGGAPADARRPVRSVWVAAAPWALLCVVLTLWASSTFRAAADAVFAPAFPIPGLDKAVLRMPPISTAPVPEAAVFKFTFISYTGTGILVAAILASLMMRLPPRRTLAIYWTTILSLRVPLLTIVLILAFGTLTRYSGIDGTLGLAFAKSGILYPFFGTLLGWIGVAATGSDTASNILFGGLQKVTAEQLGLSAILMAAANSTGGVMGKMIDTQSIVVAAAATNSYGQEGRILRFVFLHSVALACLVGLVVMLEAYVWPFTEWVIWPR
jgi:lactate permease